VSAVDLSEYSEGADVPEVSEPRRGIANTCRMLIEPGFYFFDCQN
jgi:hypothetical protein